MSKESEQALSSISGSHLRSEKIRGNKQMEMTEKEIIRRFKESKDKQQQINILAELNACKPEDIRALLKRNNIDLRGGNHGRAAIVNKDFEDAVNEMIEKDKEKAKIEAADPVPGEIGYEETKKKAQEGIPEILVDAAKLGVEHLSKEIEDLEQKRSDLTKKIEELKRRRDEIAGYIERITLEPVIY